MSLKIDLIGKLDEWNSRQFTLATRTLRQSARAAEPWRFSKGSRTACR